MLKRLLTFVTATSVLATSVSGALSPELLRRILYDEPNHQLEELGKISDAVGSLERTYLSPAHKQAALKIQQIMEDAGLEADIDRVANVRGRVRGRRSDAPVLLSGSHYDTVKDGGRFDGMLGIIVPIAAVKALLVQAAVEAGKVDEVTFLKAPHIPLKEYLSAEDIAGLLESPVEMIAFCEEEGVRFQTTFLGSRAIVGNLVGSGMLEAEDADGISARQAMGLSPSQASDRILADLAYKPAQVKAYVEVHMEQGPILEAKGLPLGVVTGIAGQTRQYVMMSGTQGHAGTIPMSMRRDPMAAAAEAIAWMEKRCGGGSYPQPATNVSPEDNLVCTTGSISLWPNTFNVVPGSANFTLDIRSKDDEVWQAVTAEVLAQVDEICRRRGMACEVVQKTAAGAVHSDSDLLNKLRSAIAASQQVLKGFLPESGSCGNGEVADDESTSETCANPDAGGRGSGEEGMDAKRAGGDNVVEYEPPNLVSGAGHDALPLAQLTKMAMVFVRCAGGHSHSPLEYVPPADVAAASAAMLKFFETQLLVL